MGVPMSPKFVGFPLMVYRLDQIPIAIEMLHTIANSCGASPSITRISPLAGVYSLDTEHVTLQHHNHPDTKRGTSQINCWQSQSPTMRLRQPYMPCLPWSKQCKIGGPEFSGAFMGQHQSIQLIQIGHGCGVTVVFQMGTLIQEATLRNSTIYAILFKIPEPVSMFLDSGGL